MNKKPCKEVLVKVGIGKTIKSLSKVQYPVPVTIRSLFFSENVLFGAFIKHLPTEHPYLDRNKLLAYGIFLNFSLFNDICCRPPVPTFLDVNRRRSIGRHFNLERNCCLV